METASTLAARLNAPGLEPDQRARIIAEFETHYRTALQKFESETRSELTRIARDKSLAGEEKIIRIEDWFYIHTDRIAEINSMADTLDRTSPHSRPVPPARPADPSPEGTAAATLHALSRRLSQGEITANEFHSLRTPLLASLAASADAEKLRAAPAFLTALPPLPGPEATPEQLAKALHAHNHHLSTLPPGEAAAIHADSQSPVNLLHVLIQAKTAVERTGKPHGNPINQPSPTR